MDTFRVFGSNTTQDPTVDSDGPMNEAQAARLRELCEKLGEPMDGKLSHKQAHVRIKELEKQLNA